MEECKSIRSSTFVNGITPTIELMKSYTREFILGADTSIGVQQIYEYSILNKYVQMSLNVLLTSLFDGIYRVLLTNLYLNCVSYGLLLVCESNVGVQCGDTVQYGETDREVG